MLYVCLVIQVDPCHMAQELAQVFYRHAIKVFFVNSYPAAQDLLHKVNFDAVILNCGQSASDTVDLLQRFCDPQLPVLVLSEAASDVDQIRMFTAGAADVMSKRDSLHLAALRVVRAARAVTVGRSEVDKTIEIGPLRLDAAATTATVNDVELGITRKQFDLLFLLASRAGKLVHRTSIEGSLGFGICEGSRSIDMHISRIRKSLREVSATSVSIHSIYMLGYSLHIGEQESVERHLVSVDARLTGV